MYFDIDNFKCEVYFRDKLKPRAGKVKNYLIAQRKQGSRVFMASVESGLIRPIARRFNPGLVDARQTSFGNAPK